MAKMPVPDSDATSVAGAIDFSGGVDSLAVTTIQSSRIPNGLSPNQLAWLINATVRDGGISPRDGLSKNGTIMPGNVLFQGSFMYQPLTGNTYIIASIGGQIYQIDPNTGLNTNLSQKFTCFNPPTQPKAYFVQGEQFLVIQAGDNITLPLFWDGTILRRSMGLTSAVTTQAFVAIKNVNDAANVGKTLAAGSVNVPGVIINNYVSFVLPAVGSSVDVDCSYSTATTLPSVAFTLPLRTSVTVLNELPENVGLTVVAGSASFPPSIGPNQFTTGAPGFTMTNYDSFVVPGVGQSVTFMCDAFSLVFLPIKNPLPYYPTVPFALSTSDGGLAILLQITGSQLNTTADLQITGIQNASTSVGTVELPPATAMDYFMGRIWYAQGRNYCAGDIVDGQSGTAAYNFTDAILKVTENPLVIGGEGFVVPSNDGTDITAIFHNANINAALGQGQLFISTSRAVYSLQVPVTRADWIAAGNSNQPLQTVVQLANAAVNDWSVTAVNSDSFFQSAEPAVRSLQQAIRYFGQWGNAQISSEVFRILQFNNLPLLTFASGLYFNNRLLQTALPTQLPQGVVHPALVALDFMPISSFGISTQAGTIANPTWEGSYEGLQILQLISGVFGGVQRSFALTVSTVDSSFEVWEIIIGQKTDYNDNRITFQFETPAFTWDTEFGLKKLVGAELWIDRLYGTVEFTAEYRADGATCWNPWHKWKECSS